MGILYRLDEQGAVYQGNGNAKTHTLSRDYSLDLNVDIPARGMAWYVFKKYFGNAKVVYYLFD